MADKLRILILEDSAEDYNLIKHEFKLAAIDAEFANVDTREGFINAISAFHPDIILSDYTLPAFDGKSALDIVRASSPEIPFIFVAGTLGEELAIDLIKSGATDYVLKNNLTKIVSAVHRALKEKENLIERRRAEENLGKTIAKLRTVIEGTIQAMAMTTEIRDPYTAGHQRRVAVLASAIGMEMRLSNDTVNGILFAGTIHDIGKIVIPSSILNKTGKITIPEFELLKTHSQAGYDILKVIDFPWPIAEIVLQHHERVDGSGYPSGLKGGNIRQEARIIAVADVVESMAYARPYRHALGIEKALEEVLKINPALYDKNAAETCKILFKDKGFIFK